MLSVTELGSDLDELDSKDDSPKKSRGKGKGRGGKAGARRGGKGGAKSKAKEEVTLESDADVEMVEPEPIGRNVEGKKKARPRPTPRKSSNKRPASATSPKSVKQPSKRTRQNTITQESVRQLADDAAQPQVSLPSTSSVQPGSQTSPLVSDNRTPAPDSDAPVDPSIPSEVPDGPSVMDVDERMPPSHVAQSSTMQVDEPVTAGGETVTLGHSSGSDLPSTRDDNHRVATPQPEDPPMIIDESDPWQDEERALATLREGSEAQTAEATTSSPLSSLPASPTPSSNSEKPENMVYSIPHREPSSGPSTAVPQFRGGAHAGSLGLNKDGSSHRRRGRGSATRKYTAKRGRV